jgi:hypothetical protein
MREGRLKRVEVIVPSGSNVWRRNAGDPHLVFDAENRRSRGARTRGQVRGRRCACSISQTSSD